MAMSGAEGGAGGAARRALVVAIGQLDIAFGGGVGFQQPDLIDHPRQRPHRIGAARIAEQEHLVAGPVAAGQIAIGAADLPVDAAPHQHVGRIAPLQQLHPGFVIDRHRCALLRQQAVGQPGIGFLARGERGHGAVEDDRMNDGPARNAYRGMARPEAGPDPFEELLSERPQSHLARSPRLAAA